MIETLHLLPPDLGPRSNPMLFGVAEAIAELFPPVMLAPRPCDAAAPEVGVDGSPEGSEEAVAPAQA